MIGVREYFRKKQRIKEEQEREEERNERRRRLQGKIILFRSAIVTVAAGVIVLAFVLYYNNKVYDSYDVKSTVRREDTQETQYIAFDGNILKYSLDGVACMDMKNNTLWNHTYVIQTPLVDVRGGMAVVGDLKGNQIFVFNSEGLKGQIKTQLPILQVSVSEQGVVAAVLEDGDTTWINLYSSAGDQLAENRTSIDKSGYPLDVAISPDGTKVAVSYMCIDSGIVSTTVAYYNYDDVGQSYVDKLVNSLVYDETVVPELTFLDNGTSVAFRDDGFSIYKGKQIPDESSSVEFEEEIQSIFYSDDYIGFIFQSTGLEYKYEMKIYNTNGELVLDKPFNMDYTEISIQKKQIVITNDKQFAVMTMSGKEKFSGNFSRSIQTVIKGKGLQKYVVVTNESIDQIKLK